MNIFFYSSLFRPFRVPILFKTVNLGCTIYNKIFIGYVLIHQVVQNCSETYRFITIYYVPGLQLKNKYARNRRIRTYTIATTHNLLCYYKLPL